MQVRLLLSGLVVGRNYEATVNFVQEGTLATGSFMWSFTATDAEDMTAYTSVPNPPGADEDGWTVAGCSIEEVE